MRGILSSLCLQSRTLRALMHSRAPTLADLWPTSQTPAGPTGNIAHEHSNCEQTTTNNWGLNYPEAYRPGRT